MGLDGVDREVDRRREILLAEEVDDAVATQGLAHGASRARDDQPDPARLEGVVDGPQRLRARHVELADRLEVEDDRVGRRVERANPRQEVVLEDVGVGEDQLRLEGVEPASRLLAG